MTEDFLYLTTQGWKSGNPHEIEIWYVGLAGCYYLISETRQKAHWIQNIQHRPSISFRLGNQTYQGSGRILTHEQDADLIRAIRALFDAKYNWSTGWVVELAPNP